MKTYDVIQIGYGPVSESLALMLGRAGRSIAVCERWPERYPLPRAVVMDHEICRVLQANGMSDVLPSITLPGIRYQWFNAEWKELLSLDYGKPSISGGSETNFVHQPTLEEALDHQVQAQTGVDLFLGWEATAILQDEDLAYVTLRHPDGREQQLAARYLVGCDGANSIVREAIGGDRLDMGFEADWLVVDVVLRDGITIEQLRIPASGQYCNPERPTTIVPAGVRDGKLFRRWEFMRLPHESVEDLEREETVWDLLKPWANDSEVDLVRHKVYNFRSLLAERWRDRRLLIAGDAAHVMPPFMGQGMCAGMRDAWNLAWKLNLVLDGKADDTLLDSYQTERLPHIRQIVEMSIFLGKIICIPDKEAAAARDEAFLSGNAPPPPAFPSLTAGLLHHDGGSLAAGAGLLSPHVIVGTANGPQRLDDIDGGGGFVVVTRGFAASDVLDPATLAGLNILDTRYVRLEDGGVADLDGRLTSFLDTQSWTGMIVRPDFYVFGGAGSPGQLAALAVSLLDDLATAGVALTQS